MCTCLNLNAPYSQLQRVCCNCVSWDISNSSLFSLHAKETLLSTSRTETKYTVLDLVYFSCSGPLRPGVLISIYPVRDKTHLPCPLDSQNTGACAGGLWAGKTTVNWPTVYSFSFHFLYHVRCCLLKARLLPLGFSISPVLLNRSHTAEVWLTFEFWLVSSSD